MYHLADYEAALRAVDFFVAQDITTARKTEILLEIRNTIPSGGGAGMFKITAEATREFIDRRLAEIANRPGVAPASKNSGKATKEEA